MFMQISPNCHAGLGGWKPLRRHCVFNPYVNLNGIASELVMVGFEPQHRVEIDRKTSRSICDAVGERLQQSLRPQFLGPAPELDRLMEELARRERQ
jgi:hypothetical protein